jgi:hypothetical protein
MTKEEKTYHIANHTAQAAHHTTLAECMKKSSDAHAALSDRCTLTDPGASAQHKALAECHKAAGSAHVQAADHHLACCKTIQDFPATEGASAKAQGGDDLDSRLVGIIAKLIAGGSGIPNGLSPIPLSARPTLVPRTGQNDPSAVVRKVDESLKHLIHEEDETGT